ncbi:hypothetical protein L596_025454 [Steinernema carpocapsae]|uniref:BPTI/Kunitz inhibitor domain-containing protein n=1 Tax=Steinernema carpocapsae TaxID=34508 RepID=A0A4U5M7U2_STECR|nr:hypothetical protein L596_025454 [Steinernema carpocapsae]
MRAMGWSAKIVICLICALFGASLAGNDTHKAEGLERSCRYNTDCMEGAHCTQGRCKCWHTHVEIEGFCWKKISPDENRLRHNLQCDAKWPESNCILGTCRCPIGQIAAPTREGTVCHQMGHCPTNSANPILYTRNTNSPAECFFYDRTSSSFLGCDDYPDLYDCIAGICCPTRSFACSQPVDKGDRFDSAQPMVKRWYFHAILGNCQQFEFTGLGGNANNFETKINCEAYCGNRCPRGSPKPNSTCEAKEDQCDDQNYKCHSSKDSKLCCPDRGFICSEFGGVMPARANLTQAPKGTGYDVGSNRFGRASFQRFYFNRASKTCQSFNYLGQGGNFNNFATEKQCREFCVRTICPAGNPIRLENGSNVQCATSAQCPRTHFCLGGHCCPTSATVCNQPLNAGASCKSNPTTRYGFNPAQGVCEKFTYNGCLGNENSFATFEECSSICNRVEEEPKCPRGDALKLETGRFWHCGASGEARQQTQCPKNFECHFDGRNSGCCPTRAHTCALKADNGTRCDPGKSTRWYFDVDSQLCLTFEYGGCDGNSNNFPNREECEVYCDQTVCPGGGRIQRTDYGKPVECDQNNACTDEYLCTSLLNPVPFQNSGIKFCCPTRRTICSEKTSSGISCIGETEIRYAFLAKDGSCRPFKFNGCGGNSNNFPSKQACKQFCSASSCAMGEIAYFPGSAAEGPFDCSENFCPDGFKCVQDALNPMRSVCCGQLSFDVCPSSERPILDHTQQKPLACSQSIPTSCPREAFCRHNSQRDQSYCCSEKPPLPTCLDGWKTILNSITSTSLGCSLDSQCPGSDSKCHGASQMQSGICCQPDTDVCPPLFSLDIARTTVVQCNPLSVDSCASDHSSVCMFSEKMNRFVCCQRDPKPENTIQNCPGTMSQDEKKRTCSFRTPCPVPFSCIRKNSDMKGICCRHGKLGDPVTKIKMQCPKGEKPLYYHGMIKECNDKSQCPHPYKCKLNRIFGSKTRICCKSYQSQEISTCPEGTVALSKNGVIEKCRDSCPDGFACHRSICCSTRNLCPHPYVSKQSSLHLCHPLADNCRDRIDFKCLKKSFLRIGVTACALVSQVLQALSREVRTTNAASKASQTSLSAAEPRKSALFEVFSLRSVTKDLSQL